MTKQGDRACPYCGADDWAIGYAYCDCGEWIRYRRFKRALVEIARLSNNQSSIFFFIDECQNCGAVVSL